MVGRFDLGTGGMFCTLTAQASTATLGHPRSVAAVVEARVRPRDNLQRKLVQSAEHVYRAGTASGPGAINCDPIPVLKTRDFAVAAKVGNIS